MAKRSRKYIYLNCLDYDGTVFQTQVLDWIHLYCNYEIKFELIQVFHIKKLLKPSFIKQQLNGIKNSTNLYRGYILQFPSRGLFVLINSLIVYFKLFQYLLGGREVLIFSRALIGKEIKLLQRLTRCRIIFFYDARAASAEEKKYISIKQKNFTYSKYQAIAKVYYLECQTVLAANKIFSVSDKLKNYFINSYCAKEELFINYPCLSDQDKFYFDHEVRAMVRSELAIKDDTLVFIYSGGISNEWHVSERMFAFFNELNNQSEDLFFLFLTKDIIGLEKALNQYPEMKHKLISFSVPNDEVYRYLNAADYGILLRENTVMNNVASPTKFAEYMLCGLPVIISEGVGDYSEYTIHNKVGFLLKESDLKHPDGFNFNSLLEMQFDRNEIALLGEKHFSKQAIINGLVEALKD